MSYLYTNKLKLKAMKATVKRNDNGKVREVNVYVPAKEDDQVEYFIDKFARKMNDSLPSVAAEWIDGIGELTNEQKLKVWNNIQCSLDIYSRDRQFEHGDMPTWVK